MGKFPSENVPDGEGRGPASRAQRGDMDDSARLMIAGLPQAGIDPNDIWEAYMEETSAEYRTPQGAIAFAVDRLQASGAAQGAAEPGKLARSIEAAWDIEPTPYNRADVAVRVILAATPPAAQAVRGRVALEWRFSALGPDPDVYPWLRDVPPKGVSGKIEVRRYATPPQAVDTGRDALEKLQEIVDLDPRGRYGRLAREAIAALALSSTHCAPECPHIKPPANLSEPCQICGALGPWFDSGDCTHPSQERPQALSKALNLALGYLAKFEPGHSCAVSNEFVAMAAVASGDTSPEVMRIIDGAALDVVGTGKQP